MLKLFINTGKVSLEGKYDDIGWRVTPIILAAFEGDIEKIEYLLDLGARIDLVYPPQDDRDRLDWDGQLMTPLLAALIEERYGAASYLLKRGANLDISLAEFISHEGSELTKSPEDVIKWLLIKGANPNFITWYGHNLLTMAVSHYDAKAVEALLDHGAIIDSRNDNGKDVLGYIADNISMIDDLEEKGILQMIEKAEEEQEKLLKAALNPFAS